MRITICILGAEVLSIDTNPPDDEPYDEATILSGGTTSSMPVGFTATYEQPDEAGLPDRWGNE